ncbi:MAG TPA: GIY-YIG nuclease family protein [Candidatus Thermoplasmatota archaeon]|nr:GIY-YIG nuclease family protein [Candidatus Thermoplasmatota archaeon]
MTGAPWHVYVVACADGTLYCGATNDLARRIAAHNAGRGARYTRGRRPVRLLWSEAHEGRSAALRREAAVKRLPRAGKLALAKDGNDRTRAVRSS